MSKRKSDGFSALSIWEIWSCNLFHDRWVIFTTDRRHLHFAVNVRAKLMLRLVAVTIDMTNVDLNTRRQCSILYRQPIWSHIFKKLGKWTRCYVTIVPFGCPIERAFLSAGLFWSTGGWNVVRTWEIKDLCVSDMAWRFCVNETSPPAISRQARSSVLWGQNRWNYANNVVEPTPFHERNAEFEIPVLIEQISVFHLPRKIIIFWSGDQDRDYSWNGL